MRAIGVIDYGGPEALQAVELPTPEAGGGQILVRVQAAAVNPADVMLREGLLAEWYRGAEKPFIPGMDIAGVIDQLGPGVDPALGLSVGQFVTGIVDNYGRHGGYSEYVALPAESVTAAPTGSSPVEAAAFLMPALTARAALDNLALPKGASLLIAGAGGAVGRYAVALAHVEGLHVTAIAAPRDEKLVLRLGADVFLPRGRGMIADRIEEPVPDVVDAVLDTTTTPEAFAAAVRDGGKFCSPHGVSAGLGRGIKIIPVNVRERVRDHAAITWLREQVEAGLLPSTVAAVFPADDVVQAHRRFDAGRLDGRIVLTFGADGSAGS